MRNLSLFVGLSLLALCCATPYDSDSREHGQHKGPKDTNCTCGWTNKGKMKIVHGKETYPNEYPWMVIVSLKRLSGEISLICGGSIVTHHHVITAAHCTVNFTATQLAIYAGVHDITSDTNYTKMYGVVRKVQHANYTIINNVDHTNDIALLITSQPIIFNKAVGPVCLLSRPIDLVKKKVKVTGWGTLYSGGPLSKKLLKANLDVVDFKFCASVYPIYNVNKPTRLCTFTLSKDSCQGDSGGPLTWLDPETNRYTLVGLVSYGYGCAIPFLPSVNTDVTAFLPWIQSKIASSHPSRQRTCAKID